MSPTPSAVNITSSPTLFITSHEGFFRYRYDDNINYELKIHGLSSSYEVTVEFIYIQLGFSASCKTEFGDVLRINESNKNNLLLECGDVQETTSDQRGSVLPPLTFNTTDTISIELTSDDDDGFAGFMMEFSSKKI